MVQGKIKETGKAISKEDILNKITMYDIYKFYCPNFHLNVAINSPLRVDRKPSFLIKQSKESGITYHIDLAYPDDPRYNGNALQFVGALFGINYDKALNKIATDFGIKGNLRDTQNIISKYQQPVVKNDYHKIDVWVRPYTREEAEYWNKRYLSMDRVKGDNIFTYDRYATDGSFVYRDPNTLSFAYYYEQIDRWKIYTPYPKDKQLRFYTNVPIQHIEGLSRLQKDKKAILAKSKKDCLILQQFIPTVVELQNESIASATPENIKYINEHSCEQFVFFDADPPGKQASIKYTKNNNYKHLNTPDDLLPKINDPDGWIVKEGPKAIENFLKQKGII